MVQSGPPTTVRPQPQARQTQHSPSWPRPMERPNCVNRAPALTYIQSAGRIISTRAMRGAAVEVAKACMRQRQVHVGSVKTGGQMLLSGARKGPGCAGQWAQQRAPARRYCTPRKGEAEGGKPKGPEEGESLIEAATAAPPPTTSVAVENAKTAGHGMVVVGFLALTGWTLYTVGKMLFGEDEPTAIFNRVFERLKDHPEALHFLGSQMKAHGGGNSRRGRHMLQSHKYMKDDQEYVQVVFFVDGDKDQAKVYTEARVGSHDVEFIVLELARARKRVVIEDNRI